MVGHNSEAAYEIDVYGTSASRELAEDFAMAAYAYGPGLRVNVRVDETVQSDHRGFEAAGIPTVLVTEKCSAGDTEEPPCSRNIYYHQSGDHLFSPANIDFAFLTDVIRSMAGFLVDMAGFESGRFARGDCNVDRAVDLSDAVMVLQHLFGSRQVSCRDACDVNDSGALDIGDAVALLSYLYGGGTAVPPPFGTCDDDPTADSLECQTFSACAGP
jgi:hypothetical protein